MDHHGPAHYNNPDPVTDIVIGMSDGFVVPLAITIGLARAGVNEFFIVVAGVIVVLIGALAMGFARYYAAREDVAHRKQHEAMEQGDAETLSKMGFDDSTRDTIAGEMVKNKDEWKGIMDDHQLGDDEFKPSHSRISAVYISISYALAGAIVLLPYFLVNEPLRAMQYSAGITAASLFLFGFIKGRFMSVNPIVNGLRVVFIGMMAALAAYTLGSIFA